MKRCFTIVSFLALLIMVNGCATTRVYEPIFLRSHNANTGIVVKFSRNLGQTGRRGQDTREGQVGIN